jgi:hypothetical protein
MVAIADGRVISVGQGLLVLSGDGRIREDYQFVVPDSAQAERASRAPAV